MAPKNQSSSAARAKSAMRMAIMELVTAPVLAAPTSRAPPVILRSTRAASPESGGPHCGALPERSGRWPPRRPQGAPASARGVNIDRHPSPSELGSHGADRAEESEVVEGRGSETVDQPPHLGHRFLGLPDDLVKELDALRKVRRRSSSRAVTNCCRERRRSANKLRASSRRWSAWMASPAWWLRFWSTRRSEGPSARSRDRGDTTSYPTSAPGMGEGTRVGAVPNVPTDAICAVAPVPCAASMAT